MIARKSFLEDATPLSAVETAFANHRSPLSETAIGGVTSSMMKRIDLENQPAIAKWIDIENNAMGKQKSPLTLIITYTYI